MRMLTTVAPTPQRETQKNQGSYQVINQCFFLFFLRLFLFFQSICKLCSSFLAFPAFRFNLGFDKLFIAALFKKNNFTIQAILLHNVNYSSRSYLTFFTEFFFIKISFSFLYTSIFLFVSSTSQLFARFHTRKQQIVLESSDYFCVPMKHQVIMLYYTNGLNFFKIIIVSSKWIRFTGEIIFSFVVTEKHENSLENCYT